MPAAKARLVRFRVLAYRSCKDAQLAPEQRLTVLIGPNGAGKTNLMQALLLLNAPTLRRRIVDPDDLYTSKCQLDADFAVGKHLVRIRSSVIYSPNDTGRDDVITVEEEWNFEESPTKKGWIKADEIELRSGSFSSSRWDYLTPRQVNERYQRNLRLLSRAASGARIKPLPRSLHQRYTAVQELRAGTRYYSASQFTNPGQNPTSFDIDEDGDLATPTRRNPHTRFLFDLFTLKQNNEKAYNAFLSLVDKRGVGLIDKIKWANHKFSSPAYEVRAGGKVITERRTRIMIIPTIYIGSAQLSFNQLSEGTFRTLAMLFYIVTDKSELLLLEEPEVCVHHGLLKSVIEVIKEYSRTKQILFSTHSETVLDSVQPEQVKLVSKQNDGSTSVRPLSKAMSDSGYSALKTYLATVGTLGEFWRHTGFHQ